ncbi:MAG: murein biosynthesis integral membrane protein MurJ [Alphaproteobacteria bacterium]|nr:murein biosynthesis integral membrane protein MurJ [Alphaproteobacteria bacterium]
MTFARSLFTVSGLTIVSRIGGFIRDTLTAMLLGAGPIADAYFVAQRLPNLFRSLFAEGAFSAAFVPLYSAEEEKNGHNAAQTFAAEALALLLLILIPFSILVIIFMPLAIRVLAPGFHDDPEKYAFAVEFGRITFPYLVLISVTALQGGVLNARGIFGPAAATPIALNIIMISALVLSKWLDLEVGKTLSWAMTLSGVVQMLWLSWSCRKAGASIPLILPKFGKRACLLFKQVGPGAIGAGATQINLFISTVLASTLPTGAVSFLFYADRLNQLPLGIVGIAVATTLLPLLSRYVATGNERMIRHYMSRSIEFCLMLGLPATVGLIFAAQPIIQTLFEHGEFSHVDSVETAKALMAYALGVPAFLLVKVLSADFFARQDTRTPVKIAILAMVVNVVFAIALLFPLQHIGIALANSIATWTNAIVLFIYIRKERGHIGDEQFWFRAKRMLLSAAGMGVVVIATVNMFEERFAPGNVWSRILGLMLIIGSSGFAYALLLQLTKAMRWREALNMLTRKE